MYGKLSTEHKKTYDALFLVQSFSLIPDKIYQLAEKLKLLMVSVEGFDLPTAEEFVREVRDVDHSAHNSSDTGNKLPKNFIEIPPSGSLNESCSGIGITIQFSENAIKAFFCSSISS